MTLRRLFDEKTTITSSPAEKTDAKPIEMGGPSCDLIEQLKDYLTDVIQQAVGTRDVLNPQASFMELGADSAQMIEMAGVLEEDLGVELYPTLFFEHPTISELSAALVSDHRDAVAARFAVQTEVASEGPASVTSAASTVALDSVCREVAVIGMDGRFLGSPDLRAYWEHIRASDDLITEVPEGRWNWRTWYSPEPGAANRSRSRWGGFIEADRFDASFFGIAPREALWLDPQLRVLLEVVHGTLEDAGCADLLRGTLPRCLVSRVLG